MSVYQVGVAHGQLLRVEEKQPPALALPGNEMVLRRLRRFRKNSGNFVAILDRFVEFFGTILFRFFDIWLLRKLLQLLMMVWTMLVVMLLLLLLLLQLLLFCSCFSFVWKVVFSGIGRGCCVAAGVDVYLEKINCAEFSLGRKLRIIVSELG